MNFNIFARAVSTRKLPGREARLKKFTKYHLFRLRFKNRVGRLTFPFRRPKHCICDPDGYKPFQRVDPVCPLGFDPYLMLEGFLDLPYDEGSAVCKNCGHERFCHHPEWVKDWKRMKERFEGEIIGKTPIIDGR